MVIISVSLLDSQDIIWGGEDLFTHMLIVGPTRSGKTATIIKPFIKQLLIKKARGVPLGLSCIEPKGDIADMVAEMCQLLDIPYVHIDPEKKDTDRFNPMEGDIDDVAEATVAVLNGLFGKQESFFATVQELSSRNVTKLLKELHGDDLDLIDVVRTLRDPQILDQKVQELKRKKGRTDLVQFFEHELLGDMKSHYQKLVLGLRAQLENITSNRFLKRIITGKSSINIDKHFAEGGVLAVNTAMGRLRKAGDAFGQFVIMHLQSGTFRRPRGYRVPHFLIVDEYSRYINPDVELFLALAAEFRVAGMFAVQSLGQLEVESGILSGKAIKQSIMTNCRNKIAFGGLSAKDAKEFAEEFGKQTVILRQSTYEMKYLMPNIMPSTYRDTEKEEYRFTPSQIMTGLPRFHFIYQTLEDGTPKNARIGKGKFIPKDWYERYLRETNKQPRIKRILSSLKLESINSKIARFQSYVSVDEMSEEEIEAYEKEYVAKYGKREGAEGYEQPTPVDHNTGELENETHFVELSADDSVDEVDEIITEKPVFISKKKKTEPPQPEKQPQQSVQQPIEQPIEPFDPLDGLDEKTKDVSLDEQTYQKLEKLKERELELEHLTEELEQKEKPVIIDITAPWPLYDEERILKTEPVRQANGVHQSEKEPKKEKREPVKESQTNSTQEEKGDEQAWFGF